MWLVQRHCHCARYWYRTYSNVCIIGSGPSGFYTASRILKKSASIKIDMIESKKEPFGLIRFGVAPDHPEVKNCTLKFKELFSPESRIDWYGGITLGKDVTLEELLKSYSAVVLSIGAQIENKLDSSIPNLKMTISSRKFTHWMNGSDEGVISLAFDQTLLGVSSKCALVIGNGNVALDIARSLIGNPTRFSGTPIGLNAYQELLSSSIRHVAIIGRRGPFNSSFAAKELREIFSLCKDESIILNTNIKVDNESVPLTRAHSVLHEGLSNSNFLSTLSCSWPPISAKSLSFFFYLSPVEFFVDSGHLSRTRLLENVLTGDGLIHPTNNEIILPSAAVVTALGYGVGTIPGAESYARVRENGPLVHERGVVDPKRGLFVSGWTKTGPAGALASTMLDSYETADSILEFLQHVNKRYDTRWLENTLASRKIPWVSFKAWQDSCGNKN